MPTEIQHTFVRANNLRFHVAHIERDGPLVLFLHGFPECWYSWRHQMPFVADAGFRVWAIDMRGYNLSDKPRGVDAYHLNVLTTDVEELLNVAHTEKVILVGHDWGALVAWRFAMDYPERLSKLVILNVPHPGPQRSGFVMPRQWLKSWYIGFFQLPWLPERALTQIPLRTARGIRASAVRRAGFTDEDIAVYRQAIAQPGAMHAAVNYYRALVRYGFLLPIKPIDTPTLMIWGEEDIALDKALTYGTEKWVRAFRIHYIPNCGHWVQNEAADEVNRLLLDFISA